MKPTVRLAALGVAIALAAACTGSGGGSSDRPTPATTTPAGSPVAAVTGPPGAALYHYANTGLDATIQFEGDTGTLTIQNGTGHELAAPGFYILDARDGTRIKGTVRDPAPVPDGETQEFTVSFKGLEDKNIGLVVLMIGSDNYGAFAPQ
ncbi:MAG TPA: hypothetical protein VE646_12325 [Actinomycetota bacterium]|nr:hypothetical protein [Actinomycetota bacterium]